MTGRQQKAARHGVGGGVVLGEDQGPVAMVDAQQLGQVVELAGGGERQLALAPVGLHRALPLGAAGGADDEVVPAAR